MSMMTEAQARAILEKVVKMSVADECTASLDGSTNGNIRFARNDVSTSGIVDDVESYLRAADIFILASNREGTPNSVLEAMATGLPCLVTPYLGISAGIGQPGEHYQLVDRDHGAIAAALTSLLQNDNAGRALGNRGLRYVEENIDQRHSLDRYAALYEELAAAATQRR